MADVSLDFPDKFQFLFEPARFKVAYGGRGGAKSWNFARALLVQGTQKPLRVLCVREFQSSIKESVHKLLTDQIELMGLGGIYKIEVARIYGIGPAAGTEFFFEGIRQNAAKIKSYEGIDVAWMEEAHGATKTSWNILTPTIRKKGSEIWVSFNPNEEKDETSQRFIEHTPSNSIVVKVSWRDNPWFTEELRQEMEDMKRDDPDEYMHVWEGEYKVILEGAIYARELRAAYADSRVTSVPHEPLGEVETFWDLGRRNLTAVWFIQRVATQVRVINYYEASQRELEHFFKYVKDLPYTYAMHWLPHDAKARKLGVERSIEAQFRAKLKRVQIVPRLTRADGISAVRTFFPTCFFDRTRCKVGLERLKNYRYSYDADKQKFSEEPIHDDNSDGADAFRMAAVAFRGEKSSKAEKIISALRAATTPFRQQNKMTPGPLGWMS